MTRLGPSSVVFGALFAIMGVAGLAVAILNAQFRFFALAAALILLLVAGSMLSKAARIANQLPAIVGRSVRIEVWGHALEPTALRVSSVRVIGAGLHIFLSSPVAGSPKDLKIAQPSNARLSDTQLTIDNAAYISLAGRKLEHADDSPALRLWWPAA